MLFPSFLQHTSDTMAVLTFFFKLLKKLRILIGLMSWRAFGNQKKSRTLRKFKNLISVQTQYRFIGLKKYQQNVIFWSGETSMRRKRFMTSIFRFLASLWFSDCQFTIPRCGNNRCFISDVKQTFSLRLGNQSGFFFLTEVEVFICGMNYASISSPSKRIAEGIFFQAAKKRRHIPL